MACRFVGGVLPPVVEQPLNIKLIARKHKPIFILCIFILQIILHVKKPVYGLIFFISFPLKITYTGKDNTFQLG